MRLYECEKCKAVNRVRQFRLDKQPVCGDCGQEIVDFPFSRGIRGLWRFKEAIVLVTGVVGLAAVISLGRLHLDVVRSSTSANTANSSPQPAARLPLSTPPPAAALQVDGVIFSDGRDRRAPLSISTPSSGGGFYLKLLYSGTKRRHLELFVNAGSKFKTQVALGKFDIVYATGERWLGSRRARHAEPFWPSVSYFRLDRPFSFHEREDGYVGHEIQLIEQLNGNLRETAISAAEFRD